MVDHRARTKKLLTKYVTQLLEHFDAVQIIVSRYNPETGNTEDANAGDGNLHIRLGMTADWLQKQTTCEDGEEWARS